VIVITLQAPPALPELARRADKHIILRRQFIRRNGVNRGFAYNIPAALPAARFAALAFSQFFFG
jgi:hypothetical protein